MRPPNAIRRAEWTSLPLGYRCEYGRLLRHDPMSDDPDLETDVGNCPVCDGKGCEEQLCKSEDGDEMCAACDCWKQTRAMCG